MAFISLIIANLHSLVDARIFRMVVTSILGLCTVESSATRVERAFDLRSSSSASFLFKSTWKQVKTIEALVFTYYTIILFNFFLTRIQIYLIHHQRHHHDVHWLITSPSDILMEMKSLLIHAILIANMISMININFIANISRMNLNDQSNPNCQYNLNDEGNHNLKREGNHNCQPYLDLTWESWAAEPSPDSPGFRRPVTYLQYFA